MRASNDSGDQLRYGSEASNSVEISLKSLARSEFPQHCCYRLPLTVLELASTGWHIETARGCNDVDNKT